MFPDDQGEECKTWPHSSLSGIFYAYSYSEARGLDKVVLGLCLPLKLFCAGLLNPAFKPRRASQVPSSFGALRKC